MPAMRLPSIVKTIHIWIGLILGVFLCLITLSGSIAVFRPQLEAAFMPKIIPSAKQADLDNAVAQVLSQSPGSRLTRVSLPTPDQNAFVLTLESEKKTRRIVVDAGTGVVAGELDLPWLDWIIDLHHNFLAGKVGRQMVGVVGIVLFIISLSGLFLFLLRRPRWRSFVQVTANGTNRRFNYELHRATGLWAYSFLTLLSLTGIALAYPDTFRAVFGQRTPLVNTKTSGRKHLEPLRNYLEASRAALPLAQITELRLPKSPNDPVSVRFRMSGDLGDGSRNELSLDANGRVLGVRRLADEPAGVRFQSSFTPIHYGEVGGLAVRILWSLTGIAPLVLFVTGLLVWFRKKPKQRHNVEEKQTEENTRSEFLVTRRSF
jgi:uncharacterized iron-regulated membrane protein